MNIWWEPVIIAGAGGFLFFALCAAGVTFAHKRIAQWETLEVDDAAQGKFVELSDGERLHFITAGATGNPIILIHGLMDSTYSWAKNIDVLAQTHRVWAIDLIGFGFSSRMTARRYSLKYSARTVREFMDAQGIERATLVGHSLGGAVALQTAHDFPERVERLVLIAPGTFLVGQIPTVANWAARMPGVPRALASISTTSPRIRLASFRHALGDPAFMDEAQTSALVQTTQVKGSTDALVAMAASPRDSDLPAGLSAIHQPTLILHGDKDSAVPVRHAERHARAMPNARTMILEGAGHIPHVEQPARVNHLILDFLRENQDTATRVEFKMA
jgi:pimeloyl-ACP methyl ester carboxylesterase